MKKKRQRKYAAILFVLLFCLSAGGKTAPRDVKIIVLADKLSNLRCTARDYFLLGDQIWERFNEKRKELHAWYYDGVAAELKELSSYPEYKEYVRLCRLVFHSQGIFPE